MAPYLYFPFYFDFVLLPSKNSVWSCVIVSRKLVKDIGHFAVALWFSLTLSCVSHLRSDLALLIKQWQNLVDKTEALLSAILKGCASGFALCWGFVLCLIYQASFANPKHKHSVNCTWVYSSCELVQIKAFLFYPWVVSGTSGLHVGYQLLNQWIMSVLRSIFPRLSCPIRYVALPSGPPVTGTLQKCGFSQFTVSLLELEMLLEEETNFLVMRFAWLCGQYDPTWSYCCPACFCSSHSPIPSALRKLEKTQLMTL